MERSVSQISRYLDRIGSPLFVQNMNGLLVSTSRALHAEVCPVTLFGSEHSGSVLDIFDPKSTGII